MTIPWTEWPRTLLPIDRWAQIIGINPLHFRQILTSAMPQTTCGTPWKSYPWQEAQQLGRFDVAMAIAEAERVIGNYLGYSLLPAWTADERLPTVRPGIPELLNAGWRDLRGFRSQVQLAKGMYISGGIEAKDLIDAGATITYTDSDGDGYPELAEITFNTSVTDASEIAVYYPNTDASDTWEIRPLRSVSIAAGVAVVTFWRHQCVLAELTEALVPTAVDGDEDANFLETVDVYRHWNNLEQQVEFLWSPLGCGWDGWGGWNCGCSGSCEACVAASQFGCLLGNDYRLGNVHFNPATWDSETQTFTNAQYCMGRQPDRLRVWYYAGNRDEKQRYPTLQMDPTWERAVAYYALTLFDRELCGCSNIENLSNHYREDLALIETVPTGSRSYQLGRQNALLSNPFGTQRGAVVAWQRANQDGAQIGRAVKW